MKLLAAVTLLVALTLCNQANASSGGVDRSYSSEDYHPRRASGYGGYQQQPGGQDRAARPDTNRDDSSKAGESYQPKGQQEKADFAQQRDKWSIDSQDPSHLDQSMSDLQQLQPVASNDVAYWTQLAVYYEGLEVDNLSESKHHSSQSNSDKPELTASEREDQVQQHVSRCLLFIGANCICA